MGDSRLARADGQRMARAVASAPTKKVSFIPLVERCCARFACARFDLGPTTTRAEFLGPTIAALASLLLLGLLHSLRSRLK